MLIMQRKELLKPHDIPIHMAHIGHDVFFFKQQTFLSDVDYYSEFPVVCKQYNQTAKEQVQVFAEIVGEYSISKRIVSDAGSNFISSDFKAFLQCP